jgi:hypothetical protein
MSSYRPPYRRNVWPDREAEKREAARRAEEEERRMLQMNDTNFPSLTATAPAVTGHNRYDVLSETRQTGGNQYAQLAQRWAVDAEADRRMEEYRRFQEAADRNNSERIHRLRTQSRYERHDTEYDDEEITPGPVETSDDSGWSEVHRKSRKPRRELTVDEMDAMEERRRQDEDNEFNAHLFDSNRHDHDKV